MYCSSGQVIVREFPYIKFEIFCDFGLPPTIQWKYTKLNIFQATFSLTRGRHIRVPTKSVPTFRPSMSSSLARAHSKCKGGEDRKELIRNTTLPTHYGTGITSNDSRYSALWLLVVWWLFCWMLLPESTTCPGRMATVVLPTSPTENRNKESLKPTIVKPCTFSRLHSQFGVLLAPQQQLLRG